MAKTSILAREKKRADTVAKFAVKRAAIKAILKDINASDDDKWAAQIQLQKMPRDASPVRQSPTKARAFVISMRMFTGKKLRRNKA